MQGGNCSERQSKKKPLGTKENIIYIKGNTMEKVITISEFADELKKRLNDGKTVDCCKPELIRLADICSKKIGNEKIKVEWQD